MFDKKTSKYNWLLAFVLSMFSMLNSQISWASDEDESVESVAAPVPLNKPARVDTGAPRSSKDARSELQLLLDDTLSLATDELYKKSTFYPFLAGVTHKGKIELIGIPDSVERPKPRTAIKALRKAAEQLTRKKRYRAMALYVDFVAERKDTAIKQPGIRVELEHNFPDALSVFIPYFIHSDNRISLMTPQFMPVEPRLFVENSQP